MALVRTFFQTFIVLGMYNRTENNSWPCTRNQLHTVFPHIVSAETILFSIWPYVLWPLDTVHKRAKTICGNTVSIFQLLTVGWSGTFNPNFTHSALQASWKINVWFRQFIDVFIFEEVALGKIHFEITWPFKRF